MIIGTSEVNCPICGAGYLGSEPVVETSDFAYGTCDNVFSYAKCGSCTTIFLVNRPDESSIDLIYPGSYTAYSTNQGLLAIIRRLNFQKKFLTAKRQLVANGKPLRVLDYGCGNGESVAAISRLGAESVAISVGYDSTNQNLGTDSPTEERVYLTNRLEAALSYGPFDLVFMNQVIEHLPDPVRSLSEIRFAMSPSGVISIETPSPTGLDFHLRDLQYWGGWHAPRHFLIFDSCTIQVLLKRVGFQISKISYIPSPYIWSQTLTAGTNSRFLKRIISIKNIPLLMAVTSVDLCVILLRSETSNMRVIATNS